MRISLFVFHFFALAAVGCRRPDASSSAMSSTTEATPLATPTAPPVADPATNPGASENGAVHLTSATMPAVKTAKTITFFTFDEVVKDTVCPGQDLHLLGPLGTRVAKHSPLGAPKLSHVERAFGPTTDGDSWTFSTKNVPAGTKEITIEVFDGESPKSRSLVKLAVSCPTN